MSSIKAPEEEERENEVMTIFGNITAKNIPEIIRTINPWDIRSKIILPYHKTHHIIVKKPTTNDKEMMLKKPEKKERFLSMEQE